MRDRLRLLITPLCLGVLACSANDHRCAPGAICGPAVSGYAVVEGTLLSATGSVVGFKQVYVDCPVAGANGDRTDAAGAFRIELAYASSRGAPPLESDGMFRLVCRITTTGLSVSDTATVPFAPLFAAVSPLVLTLREGP